MLVYHTAKYFFFTPGKHLNASFDVFSLLSFANFPICLRAKIKPDPYPCFLFVSNNAVLLFLSAGESAIRCVYIHHLVYCC